MIVKIFSVYDCKAGVFNNPFYLPTNGVAIRSFGQIVSDPSTEINKFPDDFILYELGEYENTVPDFRMHPSPIQVIRANDPLFHNSKVVSLSNGVDSEQVRLNLE